MQVASLYHQIQCPFSRPGYFTGAVAVNGDTLTIVDSGMPDSPEKAIFPYLERISRKPEEIAHIVLTHGHHDHAGGLPGLLRECAADVYVHALERPQVVKIVEGAGLDASRVISCGHGDVLDMGSVEFEVFHAPGHAAGAVCLMDRQRGVCISGDSIQGKGDGRPLLFYSAVAYANSVERLSQQSIDVLMMGHPFPPFGEGVIRCAEVTQMLEESRQALPETEDNILDVLRRNGRPLTTAEVLAATRLQLRAVTIDRTLEALALARQVIEIGEGEQRMWLAGSTMT